MAGAHASANLYSLLQTCRVNDIDGYCYLRALFKALLPMADTPEDYAALLAWRIDLMQFERRLPCPGRGGKGVVH